MLWHFLSFDLLLMIDDNFQDPQKVKTTYVADAIEALLNGKEVSISETRAIGCTIKV